MTSLSRRLSVHARYALGALIAAAGFYLFFLFACAVGG